MTAGSRPLYPAPVPTPRPISGPIALRSWLRSGSCLPVWVFLGAFLVVGATHPLGTPVNAADPSVGARIGSYPSAQAARAAWDRMRTGSGLAMQQPLLCPAQGSDGLRYDLVFPKAGHAEAYAFCAAAGQRALDCQVRADPCRNGSMAIAGAMPAEPDRLSAPALTLPVDMAPSQPILAAPAPASAPAIDPVRTPGLRPHAAGSSETIAVLPPASPQTGAAPIVAVAPQRAAPVPRRVVAPPVVVDDVIATLPPAGGGISARPVPVAPAPAPAPATVAVTAPDPVQIPVVRAAPAPIPASQPSAGQGDDIIAVLPPSTLGDGAARAVPVTPGPASAIPLIEAPQGSSGSAEPATASGVGPVISVTRPQGAEGQTNALAPDLDPRQAGADTSVPPPALDSTLDRTAILQSATSFVRSGDHGEAVRLLGPLARSGDPLAAFNLALLYGNGLGVPRNDAEAFRLTRQAAGQGLTAAMNNLGLMYLAGRGTQRSPVQASRWLKRASQQGHPGARRNLMAVIEDRLEDGGAQTSILRAPDPGYTDNAEQAERLIRDTNNQPR